MRTLPFALSLLGLIGASSAFAAPASIPVQGVFADDVGAPLDGDYSIVFTLYDDATGANQLWTSTRTVSFEAGFFTTYLGDEVPLDLNQFRTGQAWLGLAIDGDSELALIKLATSPYSGSADHAIESDTLEGLSLTEILDQIPSNTAIESLAAGVCYDDVSELQAVLDAIYLSSAYAPDWSQITSIPTDIADGDQDSQYTAGEGILLDTGSGTFSVDSAWVLTAANAPGALDAGIADYLSTAYPELTDGDDDTLYFAGDGLLFDQFTSEFSVDADWVVDAAESSGALDSALETYLATVYQPNFNDITGFPDDLADGDNDTQYTAGSGLALTGTEFTLDYTPSFTELTDIPADLADGDNDTQYTAGSGLALTGTEFTLDYTPSFDELTGVPAGLADGDDDTQYTAGAGLSLAGTEFSLNYIPSFNELTDVPAGLADGDDNTEYTPGTGLLLDGTEFLVDRSTIDDWILNTANTPGALDTVIGSYLANDYNPSLSDISDLPGCGEGQALTRGPSGTWTCQAAVPSGSIIFFAANCPVGWVEYGAMEGRTLVGVQPGGTIAGTRGSGLSNLGTRTITQVPSHRHTVDPPNTPTNTAGNHRHGMITRQDDYNVSGGSGPSFGADNGPYTTHGNNYTSYAGNHTHSVNIASFNSGTTGVGSVDVTMPYIQLRPCVAP